MKLLITEAQLETVILYIKEHNKSNKKILKEGWKDIVLGTAMLMNIKLSGVNAQIANNALDNPEIIKKIESILNGPELEKLATTLEDAGLTDAMTKIQNNAELVKQNLENAAIKKDIIVNVRVYNTDNIEK